jgi:hypothetical protein
MALVACWAVRKLWSKEISLPPPPAGNGTSCNPTRSSSLYRLNYPASVIIIIIIIAIC